MGNKILDSLTDLAAKKHVAAIKYQKALNDTDPKQRLIEPYSLSQGKQDIMLRAFQISPEAGWRFFLLHKIVEVVDQGSSFKPRGKVSLPTGQISKTYEPYENWTEPIQKYRDLVLSALADRCVSESEKKRLKKFTEKNAISIDDIRVVHLNILYVCFQHALSDGVVDEAEMRDIEKLNSCLLECGCGIKGFQA
jgi:predicted DNA-binding transcriptional regulator YafY